MSDPRKLDDIASGQGGDDIPPRTTDEKAEQMLDANAPAPSDDVPDAQQAGGTSGEGAGGVPGSGVLDAPAPVNAVSDLPAQPDVESQPPKLEDPESGDPYTGAFAVGTSAETTEQEPTEQDGPQGNRTDGW